MRNPKKPESEQTPKRSRGKGRGGFERRGGHGQPQSYASRPRSVEKRFWRQ